MGCGEKMVKCGSLGKPLAEEVIGRWEEDQERKRSGKSRGDSVKKREMVKRIRFCRKSNEMTK